MKKIVILISLVIFAFSLDIKKAYYDSYNYEKMADYKDAIKALIPVYKKYPNGYTVNLRLGWLFYLDKKYQNSLDHYKKAAMIIPTSIEAKLGVMRVYLAMKDYNNALKVGDLILRSDYYNYYGNYYEILALKGVKDYKNAINLSLKMLNIYPTDVMFLTQYALLLTKTDNEKAKKIFEDILILDPNNIKAREYLNR